MTKAEVLGVIDYLNKEIDQAHIDLVNSKEYKDMYEAYGALIALIRCRLKFKDYVKEAER